MAFLTDLIFFHILHLKCQLRIVFSAVTYQGKVCNFWQVMRNRLSTGEGRSLQFQSSTTFQVLRCGLVIYVATLLL